MAGYNTTEGEYWAETLDWPEDERWLGIYLKTCEYRISEGVFRAPAHVIAFELAGEHGSWDVPRVRTAMAGLVDRGWLAVDGNWVCVANALQVGSDRRMSASQIKGCMDRLKAAPTNGPVWDLFTAAAKKWQPSLAAVITGELVIVKSEKERGLVLEPAPTTTSPTTPATTPVTGAPTTPVTGVVAQAETPEKWEPDWGSHRGTDSLKPPTPTPPQPPTRTSSSNLQRILSAAASGPSTVLAGQVDNEDERKAIAHQLLIAGANADVVTSKAVEWLSRSTGEPLQISRLSNVVSAAFQKVGGGNAGGQALQVVEHVEPEAIAAWADVMAEIRNRGVDPATLELWLEPLAAVSLSGRVLVLGGAPHLVTWVKERGTTLLRSAAQTCGLLDLQVIAVEIGAAA